MSTQDVLAVTGSATFLEFQAVVTGYATGRARVIAWENDLVAEPGLPGLETFAFVVMVDGSDRGEVAGRIAQEAKRQGWSYLWFTNDGPRIVERHEAALAATA